MNTDILRSFVEVVRQGSYTRASEILYLSQPTVYQHVKALERILGVPLVKISMKRVLVTAEGRAAFDQAVRVLEETSNLLNSVLLEQHPERKGKLEIVVGPTFADTYLPLALATFREKYPFLTVKAVVLSRAEEINDSVLRLAYDGAIHSGEYEESGLVAEHVCDDELVIVCRRDHRLGGREFVVPGDLRDETVIGYSVPSALRRMFDSWARAGGEDISFSLEINSQHGIVMAVLAGAGVGIVSERAVAPHLEQGVLNSLRMRPKLTRAYRLVHRANASVPTALRELCDIVAATARQGA